ncbi:Plug domain-containing protein [Polaribacter sp.]|nr:Plug domain-containing protein [Polaribacter sp.]
MKSLKIFKAITLLLFIASTSTSIAQQENKSSKLTIVVKDERNKAIAGASILFDNKKHPRKTNRKGVFKIKLKKKPKEITIFSVLHGLEKVTYTGQEKIIIKINSTKKNVDLVASKPKETTADAKQYRNIYDYLRGKVAGVRISSNNIISIRGSNSWNGNKQPLLILNGVQIDEDSFGDIVPSTIRTIRVLKGPETSVYGIRGSNGVIVVKTVL